MRTRRCRSTPSDPAPRFVRGADGVSPTGLVREDAWSRFADTMYDAIAWRPPEEVTPASLEGYTSFLSSRGVVALLDAMTSRSTLSSAATLDAQGKLNLHFHGARVFSSLANLEASIADVRAWQAEFGGPHVKVDTLKLFLDGTNEFGTGAVLDPLITSEGDHGLLRMSEDDLTTAMQRLDAEGLDLHIHVVGDRGFRTALNAVERARANRGDAWRIQVTLAHDELIDPSDMPRVAGLGVILNWSPHWSGGMFGVAAAEHLGWERFNRMYQFNPIITSGGTVTYGSDVVTQYEANRADPFFGIQVGHTRIDPQYPMQPGSGTVEGTQIREPIVGPAVVGGPAARLHAERRDPAATHRADRLDRGREGRPTSSCWMPTSSSCRRTRSRTSNLSRFCSRAGSSTAH